MVAEIPTKILNSTFSDSSLGHAPKGHGRKPAGVELCVFTSSTSTYSLGAFNMNSRTLVIGGLVVVAIIGTLFLFRYEYKTVKGSFGDTLMKCDRFTGECEKADSR
jgi:hypothetical protein